MSDPEFDLSTFLPYLLNQAAEKSSLEFQNVYKDKYGMLRTEWRVLFHLGIYGRMTASEIVTKAGIHKTKVSRAVSRLTKRRFVTRERSDTDRRQEYLMLTPSGRAAYSDLAQIARTYDARLAAMFPTGEMAMLRSMLKRLGGLS